MKHITTRQSLFGKDLHDCIAWIIHRARRWNSPVPFEEALKKLRKDLCADLEASAKKDYLTWPEYFPGIFEHYYGEEICQQDLECDLHSAEEYLRNFYSSAIYREILQDQAIKIIEVEQLASFPFSNSKIPIYVKLDLALERGSTGVEIIDWKTGKYDKEPEDGQLQLGVYALYASSKWRKHLGEILFRKVNLQSKREQAGGFNIVELTKVKNRIQESAGQMLARLSGGSGHGAEESSFPMTHHQNICRRCKFKGYCLEREHSESRT